MYEYAATCRRVIDGDTLELDIDLGCSVHSMQVVRLLAGGRGMNAPELHAPGMTPEQRVQGDLSRQELERFVLFPRRLIVATVKDKKEKYGRLLATIWVGETSGESIDVGAALVANGFAQFKSY